MTLFFYELLFISFFHAEKTFGNIACDYGNYINNNNCILCSVGNYCPDGLNMHPCKPGTYSSAKGSTQCEVCNEGYYSTEGSSVCSICVTETCSSCNNQNGNCLSCNPGSGFISNNKCEKCLPGYYSTGGTFSCSSCLPNYYSYLGSSSCIECDSYCLSCNKTNGNCLSCYKGSRLSEGRCLPCQAGTFQSGNSCYPCGGDNSFSLVNSTECTKCTNCTTCEKKTGKCTSCKEGHILTNGLCFICASGTFYNETGKFCQKCVIGSFSSEEGSLKCEECPSGSYSDNEGASLCTDCDDSCSEKQCNKDSGYCISCLAGSINNFKTCLICSGGTFANAETNTCDFCPAGTYSKDGSIVCVTCEENMYSLEKSDKCTHCNDKCKTCNKTNGKCVTCVSGYSLDISGICIICPIGTYSLDSQCIECDNGHYQNKEGQNICIPCNISCSSCGKTDGNCFDCKPGYGFINDKCLICEDKEYSEGGTSPCTPCPIVCENCIRESGVCTSCQPGYKEITNNGNKNCVSCSSNGNCFSCDSNENESQRKCVECLSGYYLDNNTCLTCSNISSCEDCSTIAKECYSCANNLITDGTLCVMCDVGKVKTNKKICSECYLVINNCQLCEYNNGNPKCTLCFSPYFIENGKCVLSYSNSTHFNYETKHKTINDDGCILQVNSSCFSCNKDNHLHEAKCKPKDNNCQKYSKATCEMCETNVITTNGNCLLNGECKYQLTQNENIICLICNNNTDCGLHDANCQYTQNEFCYLANPNYYTTFDKFGQTKSCENAQICRLENGKMVDFSCNEIFVLTSNFKCGSDSKCMIIKGSDCVECTKDTHMNNSICISNNIDCSIQNNNVCILCNNKITVEGKCISIESIQCKDFGDNICKTCKDNYYKGVETCLPKEGKYENCQFVDIVTESCFECTKPYLLVEKQCVTLSEENDTTNVNSSSKTTTEYDDNCVERSSKGCFRCSDGYYLINSSCQPCLAPCTFCSNETYCTKCNKYSYAANGKCFEINELLSVCEKMMSTYDGCVVCKSGYMRSSDGKKCEKCDISCKTCLNDGDCLVCNDTYYRTPNNITKYCSPQDELTNCLNKTTNGCTQCENGFALKDNLCRKCGDNCTTCDEYFDCSKCENDTILINNKCVHYSQISNCISSDDSVCSKCSDGYKLSSDKLECAKIFNYGLVIILPIVSAVAILFFIILLITIVLIIFNKKKEKTLTENICIFKMNRSNIIMTKIGDEILSNKQAISFGEQNEEIGIAVESRELICVGNGSKSHLKVQISTKTSANKYTIRTEPKIITLKSGFACEFEIFLTPLCTMHLVDEIVLVALDLTTGKQNTTSIKITAQTKNSTRLDYDEIIEEKKLGEGSFGIVYKGSYRGNTVAIKKMKQLSNEECELSEFDNEINMLDKFRSEYIVHFFGAVLIPNKICMVTEFAQYGSLADLIKNSNEEQIEMNVRIKMILDSAKGITYLHENGILHRDIKPDNILVFSFDLNERVIAKLTDFGSARNINLLMTNMTFTKGIGTPKYMAPEILKQEKYTKSSDVYSFAITMYEVFGWCDVYPKEIFKYPWKIADFVVIGKRVDKKESIPDNMFEIIRNCWKQNKNERIQIKEITNILERSFSNK
ncbi:protein serine/threonine kinase, putative [Entamoeba invadens IP1]|uniref:Protein serine/threonine kinase, putative n=1 Tax=Entamoeba invadens IP1 TaxID=370355 RepID=A0A0A1U516_ENTIV|nr:protein serine/threonine kinase, putative [Entamoeba invadens IP1]ELP86826.1 protein serine/threonine kinase, putative [Entamoeba invadens IP1]|eukprot:XP_004253597.1 protein serine/threonine kinase, putative [Entamoeba invadens IP1]